MTQPDPFKDPQSGYGPKPADLIGKLLLCSPKKYREGIKTKFNAAADSVDGEMVILNETNPAESEETQFSFMQGRLIGALKSSVPNGMILGRMDTEPTDKGNPAFILTGATDKDKAVARAYLATKDPFDS
jgi:hypothetical protein